MMKKYDKNGNGKLEEDEFKDMRNKPERADANKDKVLTMDELFVLYGGAPGKYEESSSSRGPATSRIGGGNRVATLEERLKERGVSSKFISQDANQDGNLQMSEYSESWDDKSLELFDKFDSNRDGVISPTEWLKNGGR